MMTELNGKNALICGGSKGIGKAIAIAFAQAGASVTLFGRDAEIGNAVVGSLPKSDSGMHRFVAVDMSDPVKYQTCIEEESRIRNYHILVNNSGGPPGGPILQAQGGEFLAAFQQHLLAYHANVQALLPGMKEGGYGRIINIISTSVKQPLDNLGVSNTIRAAVGNWAKTLANELGPEGITVNNVLPGATLTERLEAIIRNTAQRQKKTEHEIREHMLAEIPLRRFAQPEEIAAAVLFLASPEASYINGINLPVDGGRTKNL